MVEALYSCTVTATVQHGSQDSGSLGPWVPGPRVLAPVFIVSPYLAACMYCVCVWRCRAELETVAICANATSLTHGYVLYVVTMHTEVLFIADMLFQTIL